MPSKQRFQARLFGACAQRRVGVLGIVSFEMDLRLKLAKYFWLLFGYILIFRNVDVLCRALFIFNLIQKSTFIFGFVLQGKPTQSQRFAGARSNIARCKFIAQCSGVEDEFLIVALPWKPPTKYQLKSAFSRAG